MIDDFSQTARDSASVNVKDESATFKRQDVGLIADCSFYNE